MNAALLPQVIRSPLLWAALVFGGLLWLVLPAGVTVMNDDFGYLGSVIETLRHGRPWTDDWLEPWSASIAGFSALVFRVTGSFQCATQGVQVAGAAAAAAAAFLLFRARGLGSGASIAAALLGLTSPTLLWKATEYTGMVLYLPCLLWAVWAARERRWLVFFGVWLVAVSTRQSAVAWLAFPLWELLTGWRRPAGSTSGWQRPALVLGAAILAFVILSLAMNHTQSQRMVTDHLWERMQFPAALRNVGIGVGTWAVFAGVGALLFGMTKDGASPPRHYARRVLLLLGAGAAGFACIAHFPTIYFEHSGYEGWGGQLYANLVIAAGVAGWLLVRFTIRWELLLVAAVASGLVGLRGDVWDYYFADIAILAFLGVAPPNPEPATSTPSRWPLPVVAVAVATLAGFHLWFAFQLKCRVDRDWAACVVSEQALRSGQLEPTGLAHAPYGFIGWHLHRHFVGHDGREDPDIGGFMRYQREGATELRLSPLRFWRDSRSLQPLANPDATRVIGSVVTRVGWLWYQRCSLLRADPGAARPARLNLDRAALQPRRLPLSDREWAEDLAGLRR